MFTTNMPKLLRENVVLTTTYLINQMPIYILSFKTPLQKFQKLFPTSHHESNLFLKVFNCNAFTHIHSNNISKLDPKATKYVFVGYSPAQKDYKYYDPFTKRIIVTLDVSSKALHTTKSISLQGENLTKEPKPYPISEPNTPFGSIISLIEGNLNPKVDKENQKNKEMIFYSWRSK